MGMKLFISQPMKGKTNEEINAERVAVIKLFDHPHVGLEVIDSFFKDAPAQAPAQQLPDSGKEYHQSRLPTQHCFLHFHFLPCNAFLFFCDAMRTGSSFHTAQHTHAQ